jgi:hypothetical protein
MWWQFLSTLAAPNVVLMHGEANEMGRLKAALQHKFTNENFPCQVRIVIVCQYP